MVVSAVVVRANLLHVLLASVHEDITGEGTKEEFHERPGKSEVSPVVAVLQDVKQIAVDIDLAVDVHLREVLERHFSPAMVLAPELISLEGEVRLDGLAGKLRLIVHARAEGGGPSPDGNQQREEKSDAEEPPGLPSAADVPTQEGRNTNQDSEQSLVAEAVVAAGFSGERSILDGGVLNGRSALVPLEECHMTAHVGHGDIAVLLLERRGLGRGGLDEVDVLREGALGNHLAGFGR